MARAALLLALLFAACSKDKLRADLEVICAASQASGAAGVTGGERPVDPRRDCSGDQG
jgi:hypothetical protein